ncbi:MAG: hypothetical protein R3Y18_04155 [Bacillota bacterium]
MKIDELKKSILLELKNLENQVELLGRLYGNLEGLESIEKTNDLVKIILEK